MIVQADKYRRTKVPNASTITVESGDTLTVASGATLTVASGATMTQTGGTLTSPDIVTPTVKDLTEVVTTTNVITAAETGTTYFLNLAGGFTSTLPAPAAGLRYKFVVKTAPTTAYIIATNGGANIVYGSVGSVTVVTDAGIPASAEDTLNFVANQAIPGDWIEVVSDGTNWYLSGQVSVFAGFTCTAT